MKLSKTEQRHLDMLLTAFGHYIVQLMDDSDVIEIMLNPDGKLWAESYSQGKFFTEVLFNAQQAGNIVKLAASYRGGVADEEHPEVACDLPKSFARFQGWIPPVVHAPSFTIRKRTQKIFTLSDYVKKGSLSIRQAEFLKEAIREKLDILIAGGTGSGKTTFANALLHVLHDSPERMVVLEDLPELQVAVEDYVTLKTTPQKSMRNLVKGALRMRPDRIIIGEVRDGAALELLKAWNTGHPGGVCTIHANSPESTIARLEDLVQEVVNVVPSRLIQQAVNVIVFMQRDKQMNYKIKSIHRYLPNERGEYFLKLVE